MKGITSTLRALIAGALIVAVVLPLAGSASAQAPTSESTQGPRRPQYVDIDLPSESTGSADGTLAVRVYFPPPGRTRYDDGAPVIIWGTGGTSIGGLDYPLPAARYDLVFINFLFPGGSDKISGRRSDGIYDNRGETSILALRDVILYAAGKLTDRTGRTIDEVIDAPILHDNIGLIGASNGGNIIVAVAAKYGDELNGHLRYLIQWETPVSSQAATRDLGRVVLGRQKGQQVDFFNPRYTGYDPLFMHVDYSDLTYDPANSAAPVFHDGNGDGQYTTVLDPIIELDTPDLNLDGVLGVDEDFPLSAFFDGDRLVYSRPVTHALADQNVFGDSWPENVLTPAEADAYWDLREAVYLYDEMAAKIPAIEGMVLAGMRDHVQSYPDKPHIHQAFDGFNRNGLWVQINPSPRYIGDTLAPPGRENDDAVLPDNAPNTLPADWSDAKTYCMPTTISNNHYQLAAIWQMADRAHGE